MWKVSWFFCAIWVNIMYFIDIILLSWSQVFIKNKQRSNFYTVNSILEKEMRRVPNIMKENFQVIILHQQPLCHIYGSIIESSTAEIIFVMPFFLSIEQIHSHFISSHMHAHTTDMKKESRNFVVFLSLKHIKNSAFCWSICSRRLRTWDVHPLCSHK